MLTPKVHFSVEQEVSTQKALFSFLALLEGHDFEGDGFEAIEKALVAKSALAPSELTRQFLS